MIQTVREWLGLASLDDDVQNVLDTTNMRVGLVACFPIMVMQLFLVNMASRSTVDATSIPEGRALLDLHWVVPTSYGLVLLAAGILFACSFVHYKRKVPQHYVAAAGTMVFAVLCAVVGILLSIIDERSQSGMFLLLTFLVSCVCIFTYPPAFSIPFMTLAAGLYSFADNLCYNLQHPSLANVIMWLCILLSSLFRYNAERLHAKAEHDANHASHYDFLTGLGNRTALRADVSKLKGGVSYIVAIMDIDDFKYFNDAFGHDAGDKVLREYSVALATSFGNKAVYRYGGDEFLVVTDAFDEQEFIERVDQFRERISRITLSDASMAVTSSIGYAVSAVEDWQSFQEDLRIADERLFYAKRQGKNRTIGPSALMPAEVPAVRAGGHSLDPSISRMHKIDDVDPLTKLANITSFLRRTQILLDDEERVAYGLYIAYLDLEGFSGYNEHYGFEAGDRFLCEVADILRETFPNHLIAHMGADRFAVDVYHDVLPQVVDTLRQQIGDLAGSVSIDLKIGVCQPKVGEHLTASIACDRAQEAAESIKGRRDKTIRIYDDELRGQIERRRYITDNFERALKRGELEVYLQPIVRTLSGKICALEALSRWNAPEFGLLSPAAYIDILEDVRLIHMLDLYMVERVASDMRHTFDGGEKPLPVSVNLSRRDFEVCDMPARIEEIMDRYQIPRNMICIEITESAMSEGGEQLTRVIERFKANGHEVWMDDFGSGYSSLNTLKDLDFDCIKIDMSFLHGMEDRPTSKTILSSIVDMAKKLGVRTLIEGVETFPQLEFVRGIGCELSQGFLFAMPRQAQAIEHDIRSVVFPLESEEERRYYTRIGMINPLSSTPLEFDTSNGPGPSLELDASLALVELRDGLLWLMEASGSFLQTMKELDLGNLVDYALAPSESPRAASLHTLMRVAKESSAIEMLDFVVDRTRYQIQARHIASMEGADAFALSVSEAHSSVFPDATASESTFLSDLLFAFDQVDIFDLATGEAQNLFRGNADYPYGYEGDDVNEMARRYVQENVHPDDRAGFIAFEDFSTAEERLKTSNTGILSAAFRIRSLKEGTWRWKTFVLVPVTFDGRACLMSAARDADIVSARKIADTAN